MNICEECGDRIDPRTGIARLFDGEYMHTYHTTCPPSSATLHAFRKMAESKTIITAQREIQMMSQLGPETYFALKGTNE